MMHSPLWRAASSTVRSHVGRQCQWNSTTARHGMGLGNVTNQIHPIDCGSAHPYLKGEPKIVSVLGAPMTYGQPIFGTDKGPDMLRNAGLLNVLKQLDFMVDDQGNMNFKPPTAQDPKATAGNARNCFAVGQGMKALHERVKETASDGKLVLALGGDHSIGAGTVSGMLATFPNLGVIWVDAHADMNTPEHSGSGNMHGMPVAFCMKDHEGKPLIDHSQYPGWEWMEECPLMSPDQIVFVGLRDVDPFERRMLRELGIKAFSMTHVDKYGIGNVMKMAIDHLVADGIRPLHLSYDVDAMDPAVAPSTGTIVRGGLSYREAHYVAEAVAETDLLVSMDLVEVNPSLMQDHAEETADMGTAIISSALGNSLL